MITLILGIVFLLLSVLGLILRNVYFFYPINELKKRTRNSKDEDAERLFKAATYGRNLRALLWLYIGLFSALSFVFFARSLPIWLSVLIIGPILYIVFSLIPARPLSDTSVFIAKLFTPIITQILYFAHPILDRLSYGVNSRVKPWQHSGLFDLEDLVKLLKDQEKQSDNRISKDSLETSIKTLEFGDKKVSQILTPLNKVKSVSESDSVGPILINEIYESQNKFVLVKDKQKGDIVGTLAFSDLNIKSNGYIRNFMNTKVAYLNENDSLLYAVSAFLATSQNLFVVLNSIDEPVGILNVDNILKELLYTIPKSDYDDHFLREKIANKFESKADNSEETELKT